MTEAEWLSCEDPAAMLNFLRGRVSDRRLRLFICGCCRHMPDAYVSEEEIESIEYGERYADGEVTLDYLNSYRANRPARFHTNGLNWYTSAIKRLTLCRKKMLLQSALNSVSTTAHARVAAVFGDYQHEKKEARRVATLIERRFVAGIVCDVFRNLIRPTALDPVWRTDTVLSLAQGMYESRDFSAMPILADALQDAGCENEDVLNHCRDEKAVHVRGCWVVDLVLGKE